LASKVLLNRVRPKTLMLGGISTVIVSLLLSSRLHTGASYPEVLVALVLLGVGSGTSLVTLTSASLAGVEPQDAGAASGLVNVIQQVGAALGLAVLVTVFGGVTGHAQLGAGGSTVELAARLAIVHGLDVVFGVGALFALVALVMVAVLVRVPAPVAELDRDEEADLVDGEDVVWGEVA
jgi:MFS family permease